LDLTRGEVLQDPEQAALDVFRELKLLVDSTCLVMTTNGIGDSKNAAVSKFSRLANWLATPQPRCAAYWSDCGPEVVEEQLSRLDGRLQCTS
jgi:hypothetical protein